MLALIGIEQSKSQPIVIWCVMVVSCAYTVYMGGSEGPQTLNLVLVMPDPLGQACLTVFNNQSSHVSNPAINPDKCRSDRREDAQ